MTKNDIGLLVLRLVAGGTMIFAHGWGKFANFSEISMRFPGLFGMSPTMALALATFADLFCAALVVIGLFSRMALIPLIITMAVAFFIVHGDDPFQKKELAFVYLNMYIALFLTGTGKIAVQEYFKISAGRFSWLLK